MPPAFRQWLADNAERINAAKSLPYFLKDNPKYSGVQPYYGAAGAVTGTKLGEHFEAVWQHPKTGKTPTPTKLSGASFDAMLGKVEAQTRAAGRYHIGIKMSENRGHVITAERLADGRITYYDAQDGAFLKLEEYAALDVEYFEVLKVDKLLLRPEVFR